MPGGKLDPGTEPDLLLLLGRARAVPLLEPTRARFGGLLSRDTAQAMSQENIELARAFLAAFIELDEGLIERQQLKEFFAPDGITTFSGFLDEQTTLRGLDEFLEFRAAWMEPYDDWSYEPEKIIDAGADRVVVTLHQRGRPHDSDSWVEMDYGVVYTVEEGLITRGDFYATPEEAVEAAGLSE